MNKKTYAAIFLVSLIFYLLVSIFQKTPGYMDAAYYYSMGKQITAGKGWFEPFIWNYLTSPTTLPTNSFTYWMPLPAIISAAGMLILRSTSFWSSRLIYIILASFIPIINISFTSRYTSKKILLLMSASLGIFSGFYLQYFTISDSFIPYMVLGSLYLLPLQRVFANNGLAKWYIWGSLGLISGLLHLCRADGILWLFAGFVVIIVYLIKNNNWDQAFTFIPFIFSYLLIMSPWYLRNLSFFNSFFAPGSGLAIFFTKYNDLFTIHPEKLSFSSFILSNPLGILDNRLLALRMNIESLLGVTGELILFPFMIVGVISLRKESITKFTVYMMAAIFIVMTFVFPFAGSRGGFIHSASSLQCFFWAITPIGFDLSIKKIAKWRSWKPERSIALLGSTLISVLVIITGGLFFGKVIGWKDNSGWDNKYQSYVQLEEFLNNYLPDNSPIMINDSPGFYTMTGRSAIQLTVGSLSDTKSTMSKFGSKILVLDEDHSSEYSNLYSTEINSKDFVFLGKLDNYVVYQIAPK